MRLKRNTGQLPSLASFPQHPQLGGGRERRKRDEGQEALGSMLHSWLNMPCLTQGVTPSKDTGGRETLISQRFTELNFCPWTFHNLVGKEDTYIAT